MPKRDVDEILGKRKNFENDYARQMQALNKGYQLASGFHKPRRSSIYMADSSDPELFAQNEALATAYYDMIFSDNTEAAFFDVEGVRGEADMLKAIYTKAILVHQLGLLQFKMKMMPFFRNLSRDGVRVAYLPWKYSMKTTYEGAGRLRREQPGYDCFDFVDVETLRFGHSGATQLQDNAWIYQLMPLTTYEARRMQRKGYWKNVEDVLERGGYNSRPGYITDREQFIGLDASRKSLKEGFEAISYWGELENRNDGLMYWCEVATNGVELRAPVITPYNHGEFPFEDFRIFGRGDSFYSIGLAGLLGPAQVEINDRLNMIQDNLNQLLFNMWMMGPDAGISAHTLRWQPWRVLQVERMDQLEAIRPPADGLRYAMEFQEMRKKSMRQQSGASETLQAMITKATATEVSGATNEAVRRAKVQVKTSIAGALRCVLQKYHAMNKQFLDPGYFLRVTDKRFQDIYGATSVYGRMDKKFILDDPDISMKISTDNDFRQIKRDQLGQFLTTLPKLLEFMATQAPQGKTTHVNVGYILKQWAKLWDMDPDLIYQEVLVGAASAAPGFGNQVAGSIISESPAASSMLTQGPPGMATGNEPTLDAILRRSGVNPI